MRSSCLLSQFASYSAFFFLTKIFFWSRILCIRSSLFLVTSSLNWMPWLRCRSSSYSFFSRYVSFWSCWICLNDRIWFFSWIACFFCSASFKVCAYCLSIYVRVFFISTIWISMLYLRLLVRSFWFDSPRFSIFFSKIPFRIFRRDFRREIVF